MFTENGIPEMNKKVRFDVFVTAMEGGINYWASVQTYRWRAPGTENTEDHEKFVATIKDREDGKRYTITPSIIELGVKKALEAVLKGEIANPYHKHAIALMAVGAEDADYDADTADIIIQYAVLGELTYN